MKVSSVQSNDFGGRRDTTEEVISQISPPYSIRASLRENWLFAFAKTKTQISFAVTAKLISAFVFAIRIVQSLYYLNPKFQASSHLLWLCSPVCVGPGRKPRRPVCLTTRLIYTACTESKNSSHFLSLICCLPISFSVFLSVFLVQLICDRTI